jgi:hypothetical protein
MDDVVEYVGWGTLGWLLTISESALLEVMSGRDIKKLIRPCK